MRHMLQVLVWSTATGERMAQLPMACGAPCLDVKAFVSQSTHCLAALTETKLHVFAFV